MNEETIKKLFPNASGAFLRANLPSCPSLVKWLCYPELEQDAGPQPLDPHQDEKGGQGSPAGRVKVTIIRHGARLLDLDNGAGGCKPILDALRYEGVIKNDDPGTIEFAFKQVKSKELGTEILIEPIP